MRGALVVLLLGACGGSAWRPSVPTPAAARDVRTMLRGACQIDHGEEQPLVPTPEGQDGPIATASFDGWSATLSMSQGYGQDTFDLVLEREGVRIASASTTAMIHYLGRSLHEYVDALLPPDTSTTDRLVIVGTLGGYDAQSLSLIAPIGADHYVDCRVFFSPPEPPSTH